jgi:ribosomal protein L11 methyltransferase
MNDKSWLETSLIVDGELAEAVAEVLARFAPNGVVIESTAVTANPDDSEGHPVGPLRVCAYLPVDEHLEETRRRLEEALWYLGRIRPLPEPTFSLIQEADWSESWKVNYKPIAVGQRLMIVPAWLENPQPERIAIRIDPGMAFGTGTHPTTQLCLELMESCFGENAANPASVIDVGCGSGILSIAALKLGSQRALGVDIDAEAIGAAHENAALNGVSDRLEAGLGSVREIHSHAFGLQTAPLVLANILAPVIISLLGEGMADLLAPGGSLILSGILDHQAGEVAAALRSHQLELFDQRQQGDWVALMAKRV